ncbi:hypothetical protein I6N95_18705 [Vagococcus sp. BWB3-3]|uniref:Lipoprotein n=1 Tax=Vagococcus allomyrinae TaxID=2794353 RepID=A0A940SW79_9ENTE|nr:hypothetical protein [Vagococcus allomyrinae]MBP1043050.1 hypothetical protein [Vagococcus allomyrinae]
MKKNKVYIYVASLIVLALFLVGCSVSDDYQGEWFALDGTNSEVIITIDEKNLIYEKTKHPLKQVGVGTENGMKYYKIKLDDESFILVYPEKENENEAVIIKPNDEDRPLEGKILFKMNRKEYPKQN